MNKFFTCIFSLIIMSLTMFTACGDDGSSEEIVSDVVNLKSSFEIILDKSKYVYNSKDSSIVIKKPVCKEGTLGNLVWKSSEEEPDTSYVYLNKSVVTYVKDKETQKFTFDGSKFPIGLWMNSDDKNKSFQNAFKYTSDNFYKEVFRYDGKCFLKDFYTAFRKGNSSLEMADSVLSAFYMRFKAPGDSLVQSEILNNIRVPDCDQMYLYDDLVKVSINEFTSHSGNLSVSYKEKSCSIIFDIRYAYDESDCKEAYADWMDDKNASKEFLFENYAKDIMYDDYCIEELILAMKKAEGIPLKKSALNNDLSYDFSQMIVNLFVMNMK